MKERFKKWEARDGGVMDTVGGWYLSDDDLIFFMNNLNNENLLLKNKIESLEWEIEILQRSDIIPDLVMQVAQLKQQLDNLYEYYFEWFEGERGVNRESFNESWIAIMNGEIDDELED